MFYVNLVGKGIYSVSEASKLSGVEPRRVRRWVTGYKASKAKYDPLWRTQIPPNNGCHALGFLDLIELRFIRFFMEKGVSLSTLKKVRDKLQSQLETSHPFCTGRFVTDGKAILEKASIELGEKSLVEVLSGQAEMPELVESFIKSLDFKDESMASRWWPLGREKPIIIDPKFNFGHPAVDRYGVGTDVLVKAVKANGGSINLVADWYDIPESRIRAALEFEEYIAA